MPLPNVIFLGSSYWCNYLKQLLNESGRITVYSQNDLLKWVFQKNKAVCLVGIGPPNIWKRKLYYLFALAMDYTYLVKRKVIYWIGSDVTLLTPGDHNVRRFINIAGSQWLADEVAEKGYECETAWFPVKLDIENKYAWPESDGLHVLCYIPDNSHALHGADEIDFLARKFPAVKFDVVGGLGAWCKDKPANLEFHGWVKDIEKYIERSSVLLRRTRHDSFSAFVREGILAGRYVIFTYNVPYVTYVKSGDLSSLEKEFRKIEDSHKAGTLLPVELNDGEKENLLDYRKHLMDIEDVFF